MSRRITGDETYTSYTESESVSRIREWAYYAIVFLAFAGFAFVMLQLMWVISGQEQIPLDEIGTPLTLTPEGG